MTGDLVGDAVAHPLSAAPTVGAMRIVRGAAVGVSATSLALAGHVAAGGPLPTPAIGVILVVASVSGSVALSGRRWTPSALLTVLLGVQVVFHVAFADHHGAAGMHHAGHSLSASMMLGHLLAALATALLLNRGESWCWQLLALLGRPVHVARGFAEQVPATSAADPLQPAGGPLPLLRSRQLADAQPRRGPPALLAR
jgi:hypothetical protein